MAKSCFLRPTAKSWTVAVSSELLADMNFAGPVIEWRGPASYYFIAIPEHLTGEIRWAATQASYGWGVVPVTATIGGVEFATSLFPRDGSYFLPLKIAVRRQANIAPEGEVAVSLRIYAATAVTK